jgi:hypothetical protein
MNYIKVETRTAIYYIKDETYFKYNPNSVTNLMLYADIVIDKPTGTLFKYRYASLTDLFDTFLL